MKMRRKPEINEKSYKAKVLRTMKSFIENGSLNDMPRDQYKMNQLIRSVFEKSLRVVDCSFRLRREGYNSTNEILHKNKTKLSGAALTELLHSIMLSLIKGGANISHHDDTGKGETDIEFIAEMVALMFYEFEQSLGIIYNSMPKSTYVGQTIFKKVGSL